MGTGCKIFFFWRPRLFESFGDLLPSNFTRAASTGKEQLSGNKRVPSYQTSRHPRQPRNRGLFHARPRQPLDRVALEVASGFCLFSRGRGA